jgi:ribonuclease-3
MIIDEQLLQKPLFQTAFTHRSFLNESSEKLVSNERLEFLGDAVLSFIMSSYLYNLRPEDAEGQLTNLRSYIVKTQSLAKASQTLKFGEYLKLSKGEAASGGRDNPQLLANAYEAVLGAIYLDQGLDKATEFVMETLIPLFKDELESGPPKDAKSQLQEISQNQTKQSPRYKILETTGPDHAKYFTVGVFLQGKQIGSGQGSSKQIAEEKAAEEAIKLLESTI